jgi:hypothetical protein
MPQIIETTADGLVVTNQATGLPDMKYTFAPDGTVKVRVDSTGANLGEVAPAGGHWAATCHNQIPADTRVEADPVDGFWLWNKA